MINGDRRHDGMTPAPGRGGARAVLERRPTQSVMIGHDIEVTLLDISDGEVQVVIRAPDGMVVTPAESRSRR